MTTFSIYLLGYILAYFSGRYYEAKVMGQGWAKKDRLQCLMVSIFSWITFFTAIYHIVDEYDNNEPASW